MAAVGEGAIAAEPPVATGASDDDLEIGLLGDFVADAPVSVIVPVEDRALDAVEAALERNSFCFRSSACLQDVLKFSS